MLDVDNATTFLIDRALIPVSWIVEGDLIMRSVARRNRNLRVEGPDGTGLFIKQPDDPASGSHETLRREAAFHRFCRDELSVAPVTRLAPQLLEADNETAVVVFELIAEAVTLRARCEAEDGIMEASQAFGHALGTVHRVFRSPRWDEDPRLALLPRSSPWVFDLQRPGIGMLADLSPANFATLRVLQNETGFGEPLARLLARWRSQTVIHGDIRFDNVLIRPRRSGDVDSFELRLVDWEMVQFGDPAWDVAGALQEFLVFWVSTMPQSAGLTADEKVAGARVPLTSLRRGARAMWSGYRQGARLGRAEAEDLLPRAVAFSSARLIQSAFEAADGFDHLPGESALLLQIGANLLADPAGGQAELYGITSGPRLP
jgi:hypothetical protein